jgi:glycosyltransferase involved in cell wall biosynthesis
MSLVSPNELTILTEPHPRLSVVVPLLNERDNVRPLVAMVGGALGSSIRWELILVDDGSTDDTWQAVVACAGVDPRVRPVRLAGNHGQAIAMQAGFDHARGDIVATLDGDLQNDAADIPAMIERLEEGYDMVVGYRVNRQDRMILRRVPSWAANRLLAWTTGIRIRDTGCSLKVYRRVLIEGIRLYADLHRFIPALAVTVAHARIAEMPVRHHRRARGESKYGLGRTGAVLADLLTIRLLRWSRLNPIGFFCSVALLPAAGAAVTLGTWFVAPLGGFVLAGSSVVLLALAAYLVMLGLVAEVVVPERGDRPGHDTLLTRVAPVPGPRA